MIELAFALIGEEFCLLSRGDRLVHGHTGMIVMLALRGDLREHGRGRKRYCDEREQKKPNGRKIAKQRKNRGT